MGITVHYRGKIADLSRVEDFEDRVIDLALELGGNAQIWRSSDDDKPDRMVRGVILHLAPGQDSTSLLLSPEGWLINLFEIEDAERGKLKKAPWVFCKTQFGTVEGHVALVELLDALKREFFPDLDVNDEGGYWESRDPKELAQKLATLQAMIDGLAEGLQRHGLSPEAAEDPEILIERIRRVAELVHRNLRRPSEHAPVTFGADDGTAPTADEIEAKWNEMFKHNRRQQERLERAIEERLQRGEDHDTAYANAMRDIGLPVPGDKKPGEEGFVEDEAGDWSEVIGDWQDEDDDDWDDDELDADEFDDDEWLEDDDLEWLETDGSDVEGEAAEGTVDGDKPANDKRADEEVEEEEVEEEESTDEAGFPRRKRHPLVERATEFWLGLAKRFKDERTDSVHEATLRTLFQGAGDLCGGLVQAMSGRERDRELMGLNVVQLKRALRGLAFAKGALFPMKAAKLLSKTEFDEMHGKLTALEKDIFQELGRVREEMRGEEE